MKHILLSIFLILSIPAIPQTSSEFIYSGDVTLRDVEKAEYFEVDYLYSCGSVYDNFLTKPLINKTDVSGNLYWSKKIEIPEIHAMANNLCVVSEDEIYILAAGLLKMNGDGEIIFHKSIESSSSLSFRAIEKTPDDHLLVCGNLNDDIIVLKFDTLGNLVNHLRAGSERDEIIRDMSVDQDGNITLVGASANSNTNVNTKGLIMKLNQDLEILWSKTIYRENVQNEDYIVAAFSSVNSGANTIMVMEATGDVSIGSETAAHDIGLVEINGLGEIETEKIIDIGLFELPEDLIRSEEGDLIVTGTNYVTPFEPYSSFVLSLNAQLEPIFANYHSKDWDELLMYKSTIITENPLRLATVGVTSINQQYQGLQSHHSLDAGLCTAAETVPIAYDPDFILEDTEMEVYDQEYEITDLGYELTNAFNSLLTNCSETLSDDLPSVSEELSLFPNPTTENFQISGINHPSPVLLRDALGRTIREFSYEKGPINISDLSPGIYLVEVNAGKTFRLIKE